jgi:hypothetical protein
MRSSMRARVSLVGLLLAAGCGDAVVVGNRGGGGAGSPVDPERPVGGSGGGSGGAPATGGSGGGITLPPPSAPPPDAAPTQCAADVHKAEIVPLELMLLVDTSGSMTGMAGMRSKWETAQAALRAFVSDPKSAGLSVGLQFFPRQKPCSVDKDCVPTATTTNRYCTGKQFCAGPNGPGPMPRSCGAAPVIIIGPVGSGCPMGTTCQPAGYCATSGDACTNVGRACPMGAGTCEAAPKACTGTVFGGVVAECEDALYEPPTVGIEVLPMGQTALTRALDRKTPTGGTPMGPAVRGVLTHLRARLQANPGRKVALILASDGLPGGCQRNDIASIAADLTTAFGGAPSIPTYVIGVFSAAELPQAQPQVNMLAMSGGTNEAFVLTANDDLNMRLLDALNQIRGAALACEYTIPAARMGNLDFGQVNVRYTGTAGPENIPYVERMDRCDPMRGGWYYDVHPSMGRPSRVLVCPATCGRFKSDKAAQVELVFGCATQVIN